jgi:hypothetical protein
MLSAHTSIPSLDIWGANPSRSIDVIGRVIDRTAADETELNDIRTRYRYALKGGMGKPIGGRPPLFRDVTHEMVAGTHFGGWEPRHALFDVGHQHRVPRGDIPTYLHVFGNIGMGGLNEGMGELRSMKSNLGREGKYLVMPDIEDLRRRYQRPVGEIFVHDMIYGHKAGD